MADLSFLVNADPAVLDDYYKQYLNRPADLDDSWQKFFEGFEFARSMNGHAPVQAPEQFQKEVNVINLIGAYRQRGHLFTKTNPVRQRRDYDGKLTLQNFNLSESDLDTVFQAGIKIGLGPAKLRDIIRVLDETYCQSIGVEYQFIRDPKTVEWLQSRMESSHNRRNYTKPEKLLMLQMLTQSVVIEKFMHQRFVGQKRFSLEGIESFVPAMDTIVEAGADMSVREFIIGMAHRGRLNLITNVLGKEYHHVFHSFEGKSYVDEFYAGDVKYHLGHSGVKTTRNGKNVHLSLMPNPSHLEAIDPVVVGVSKAKLDQRYGNDENAVVPILVHGDSSIAGQGVVYEVLQMSAVEGFRAGGALHIVLNNQVGFTTNYWEARSSTYCTDVAKVTLSPVFHVNADDVEAVVYTVQLALEFRQTFHRDVFIDLLGYRKHGHNEGDEPRFTQPLLYKAIAAHPNPMEIYRKKLIDEGVIDEAAAKQMEKDFLNKLDQEYERSKDTKGPPEPSFMTDHWAGLRFASKDDFKHSPETGVPLPELKRIATKINTLPSDKKFFNKVEKIFADRRKMIEETDALDWGMAELLAYGTLVEEGHRVRISGEDVERGTFSHRHAMVRVEDSDQEYFPLQHISKKQAPFEIYNSILSEFGVMGFEYGYAMGTPNGLIIWEAQFGDFANGAQIVIDQFISSGEAKWRRSNGLVLFLPHGPEGQGPEHSSARLERYLELCADASMQVVQPTTPANFFHVLRRQLKRPFRVPLIVLTPKSLLRHPKVVSKLKDMGPGTKFQEVLDDPNAMPKSVKHVLMTSGKIYYDLLARKEEDKRKDVAIIRLEQFFPLPKNQLEVLRDKYSGAQWTWVQEEPQNMGAWPFLLRKFDLAPLRLVSRKESCTPASGFTEQHEREQKELVEQSFA